MTDSPLVLSLAQVRAARILSQGFAATDKPSLAATLERSGFVRTLGGVDAYLAVRARRPQLARADLDAAVAERQLLVSPAVRGCMYLVAAADVPLCLTVAAQLSAVRDARDADKAGIAPGEIDKLGRQVVAVLRSNGPLPTDGIRKALPAGAVRSLGERGKKVGVSSPLPQALRQLEFGGLIERTPVDGRLDHERYLWRVAVRNPLADGKLPGTTAGLHAVLLQRFLSLAGAATLRDFCAWSGLSQQQAKAALPHAQCIRAVLQETGDELLAHADITQRLRRQAAAADAVALLPFEDNLTHLGGGAAWFVDPAFHDLQVPVWGGGKPTRLGDAGHPALRAVLADGGIRGFWEYDPDAGAVITRCLAPVGARTQQRIDEAAQSTGTFLREQLSHGRSFSLDTDDELRKRLAVLATIGSAPGRAKAARPAAKAMARPVQRAPARQGTRAPARQGKRAAGAG